MATQTSDDDIWCSYISEPEWSKHDDGSQQMPGGETGREGQNLGQRSQPTDWAELNGSETPYPIDSMLRTNSENGVENLEDGVGNFENRRNDLSTVDGKARGELVEEFILPKRHRGPKWSYEEKHAYLIVMIEALRVVLGPVWKYISLRLWEGYGYDRNAKSCEDLWGTLRKSYKEDQLSEASRSKDDKSEKKSPRHFPREFRVLIAFILDAQAERSGSGKKNKRNAVLEGDDQHSVVNPVLDGPSYKTTDFTGASNSDNASWKTFGASTEEKPSCNQLVEEIVNSEFQRSPSGKELAATTTEDDLTTTLSPLVTRAVKDSVHSSVRSLLPSSSSKFHEDDILAPFASHFKKQIADAVHSELSPFLSHLQKLAQDEHEYQRKKRAIALMKRALKYEERQNERRRKKRSPVPQGFV